jgi:hypothetical protein
VSASFETPSQERLPTQYMRLQNGAAFAMILCVKLSR